MNEDERKRKIFSGRKGEEKQIQILRKLPSKH